MISYPSSLCAATACTLIFACSPSRAAADGPTLDQTIEYLNMMAINREPNTDSPNAADAGTSTVLVNHNCSLIELYFRDKNGPREISYRFDPHDVDVGVKFSSYYRMLDGESPGFHCVSRECIKYNVWGIYLRPYRSPHAEAPTPEPAERSPTGKVSKGEDRIDAAGFTFLPGKEDEARKYVTAFHHLQDLCGGKKKDLFEGN